MVWDGMWKGRCGMGWGGTRRAWDEISLAQLTGQEGRWRPRALQGPQCPVPCPGR